MNPKGLHKGFTPVYTTRKEVITAANKNTEFLTRAESLKLAWQFYHN